MSIPFFMVAAVVLLTACNEGKTPVGTAPTAATLPANTDPQADSASIRHTITSFYSWYQANYMKFPTSGLYKSVKTPDMPPYQIDWDAVKKYHDFIRSSVPQLGEAFIEDQRKFFELCDAEFKKDTEGEIPYGFDYDWYTNSQEDPQYLIDEMNKSHNWKTSVNGDNATVEVMRWRDENGKRTEEAVITLDMKKEAGKWTIARIGGPY